MTHLTDEQFSLLIDDRLASAAERDSAQAHLAHCADCEQRLAELRSVVALLHRLPEVEPPRDFRLGPRPVSEPANVVRLRRWYAWTRTAGASLAAVFVLLVGGAVYVDLTAAPATPYTTEVASTPAPPTAAPAPRAAQPAPAGAAAQSAKPAAALATPVAESSSTDQVIATTSAQALPTFTPPALLPPLGAVAPAQPGDPGAPLRLLASLVGIVAAASLLGALAVGHRLRRAERQLVREV